MESAQIDDLSFVGKGWGVGVGIRLYYRQYMLWHNLFSFCTFPGRKIAIEAVSFNLPMTATARVLVCDCVSTTITQTRLCRWESSICLQLSASTCETKCVHVIMWDVLVCVRNSRQGYGCDLFKTNYAKLRDKFKVVWLDEDYEDVHASIASWLLRRGEGRWMSDHNTHFTDESR